MNRRSFLRLFAATTSACIIGGNKLYNDTSHDVPTALQVFTPLTPDEQVLWAYAQKLYELAYFTASFYQIPMKVLFGRELTVQDYYVSLREEYRKKFELPKTLQDIQLEYVYHGREQPQTLELVARIANES
jgi:hypothetical protein